MSVPESVIPGTVETATFGQVAPYRNSSRNQRVAPRFRLGSRDDLLVEAVSSYSNAV